MFKSEKWFERHMERGVHKKPAVSMKTYVYQRMQFHVAQSKQVTSMHFKTQRQDIDGEAIPEPPSLEGYIHKLEFHSNRGGQGNQKGKGVLLACLR